MDKQLYDSLINNISKSVKESLNEDIQKFDVTNGYEDDPEDLVDHQTIKKITKKKKDPNTYRGIEGTRYIWHGEWSDPEVIYNDCSLNAYDIEDLLWQRYRELCLYELDIKPTENGYEEWLDENPDEIVQALFDLMTNEY